MVDFIQSLSHIDHYMLIFIEELHMHCEPTYANTESHFMRCEYCELACLVTLFLQVNHRQTQMVHSYHSRHRKDKSVH